MNRTMKTAFSFLVITAFLFTAAAVVADCPKRGCGGGGCENQNETPPPEPKDIVDTALAAGSFNTLAAALTAADLIDTLKGEGPFTVFAPTDEAFAKLPEGTVEALLQDKEKLTAILTYHVVAGQVTAADVVELEEAETLQGSKIRINAEDGVRINSATVIAADVMASNGVIHVIDEVLLPE
jgi:uncharacterized surface protein with fasciclin (FAS1) repeats